MLIKLKENLNLLAHLDTGNQHNCSKMCAMLSLFKEFITKFESTWVIILKQLFSEGEDKIEEYLLLCLWQIVLNFYSLLCHFTILAQQNTQNMPWLCSVEQDMNFSAVNFKAHKNFVLVIRKLKWFLFCCFLVNWYNLTDRKTLQSYKLDYF